MPADEYVAMASDPHVLGDPLLKTQHFIGSSKWEYVSDTEAIGWHQLRVPHQRYKDESRTEIAVKGHAHGSNQHWYKKINNVWKFAGLAPIIRWGEFDFDSVFASGRDTFGDSDKVEEQVAVAAGVSAQVGLENASEDLENGHAAPQSPQSVAADVPGGVSQSAESIEQDVSDRPEHAKPMGSAVEIPIEASQPHETHGNVSLTGRKDSLEPVTIEQPDTDPIHVIQVAKEDGKLFEMQVEQVPSDDGSFTA